MSRSIGYDKTASQIGFANCLYETHFFNSEVTHVIDGFKSRCDVIITNRMVNDLNDVSDEVFTRDLFGND